MSLVNCAHSLSKPINSVLEISFCSCNDGDLIPSYPWVGDSLFSQYIAGDGISGVAKRNAGIAALFSLRKSSDIISTVIEKAVQSVSYSV